MLIFMLVFTFHVHLHLHTSMPMSAQALGVLFGRATSLYTHDERILEQICKATRE